MKIDLSKEAIVPEYLPEKEKLLLEELYFDLFHKFRENKSTVDLK